MSCLLFDIYDCTSLKLLTSIWPFSIMALIYFSRISRSNLIFFILFNLLSGKLLNLPT